MTVGLIDVDGRVTHKKNGDVQVFPNIALMKLSAFHKSKGDSVEWCFPLKWYDRIYASKIFTFTKDIDFIPQTNDFRKGGTGYFYPTGGECLPYEIEHIMPDYSLYGITDTAYGFLSRGCPRGCPFCIVKDKEGRVSHKVADLKEWWSGQKYIELMDPNMFACKEWRELSKQLIDSKSYVNINQGADIRIMNDEHFEMLAQIKLKNIHFAWDRPEQDLKEKFKKYANIATRKFSGAYATVYVLVNYNSTMDQNLYRIYTLRDLGYDPYVMIYDKDNAPKEIKRLQRWVNNRMIWKSCKRFEDYQ